MQVCRRDSRPGGIFSPVPNTPLLVFPSSPTNQVLAPFHTHLNLTYAQFAQKVGLSDSTLHRLEMADQNVALKTLERLSQRLKCKIGEMLGEA